MGWITVPSTQQRLSACEYYSLSSSYIICSCTYSSIWLYKDCESFAGAINWVDCTEGPDSCYAYVEDDCVYTGERIGEKGVAVMG